MEVPTAVSSQQSAVSSQQSAVSSQYKQSICHESDRRTWRNSAPVHGRQLIAAEYSLLNGFSWRVNIKNR